MFRKLIGIFGFVVFVFLVSSSLQASQIFLDRSEALKGSQDTERYFDESDLWESHMQKLEFQYDSACGESTGYLSVAAKRFETKASCMDWCEDIPKSEFNSKWGSRNAQCNAWCDNNSADTA